MRIFNLLFNQLSVFILLLTFTPESINSVTTKNNKDTFKNPQNIKLIDQKINFLKKNIENSNDSIKNAIIKNLKLSQTEDYNYGIGWNYFLLGRFHQLKQENDSAIYYYQKAWPVVKAEKELNLASAVSMGLTNVYWETGDYSAGLQTALDAEKFFKQHNALNDKYAILNLIALNYEGLFEYDKALEYFNKTIEAAKKSGREDFLGVIYSNIGNLYYKQKQYNKALEYLRKGSELEKKHLFFSNAGKSFTMMANAFLKLEQFDSTLVYLKRAYQYNINTDDNTGLARTYLGYGEYYLNKKRYSASVEYLFKALEVAKPVNLNNEILKAYQLLAQNYEITGNYKQSTTYYKKYFSLYQQMYNVEKINQLNALEHKLKLQIKENEINRLKIKEEEQTIKYLNYLIIAGLMFTTLLLVFIFNYRKNNKILKQKNKEINEQKDHLEKLNEKLILAESDAGKADQIKTKFLNNLSHEIRTPLNGIVGFSSLIAESKLSEHKKPQIWNIIRKNSEELINTIDGLLELSMVASGDINLRKTAFNVYDFLSQLQFEISDQYKDITPSIELKFLSDKQLNDRIITTDKEFLKNCILKLVNNAFKFTRKGTVELSFMDNDEELKISISDTGIGILEDTPGEIFTQFMKGKNIPNNSAGLGIGLTISKQFIKFIDGKLWYETEINKGSTFFISIPFNN